MLSCVLWLLWIAVGAQRSRRWVLISIHVLPRKKERLTFQVEGLRENLKHVCSIACVLPRNLRASCHKSVLEICRERAAAKVCGGVKCCCCHFVETLQALSPKNLAPVETKQSALERHKGKNKL